MIIQESYDRSDYCLFFLALPLAILLGWAGCADLINRGEQKIKNKAMFRPGAQCQVAGSDSIVVLVQLVNHNSYGNNAWACRVDNGVGATPRFTETVFMVSELQPLSTKVEQ
jgi:hypothetical protein